MFRPLLCLALAAAAVSPPANPLGGPEGMADRLVFWDDAGDWRSGEMRRAAIDLGEPARVVIHDTDSRSFPRDGLWTSPVVETEFQVTEVLPSWNADAPGDTGLRFEARVRDAASGEWSPWLHMGSWGEPSGSLRRVVSFDGGEVDVDVLVLERPADALQLRVRLESRSLDRAVGPSLRRLAVAYSGPVSDEARRSALMPPPDLAGAEWSRVLDVPHQGQGQLGRPLSAMCCSPTSTTMVLQALGAGASLLENSMAIYDPDYQIFGNWNRAVAYAGSLGLDAWLTRYRSWDQAKASIAEGQPVICSIRVSRGDLDGVTYTGGHLVVLRGFTPEGDPVINDPAYGGDRGRAVTHRAEQFARVWLEHGGVGYIIRPHRTEAGTALPLPPAGSGE